MKTFLVFSDDKISNSLIMSTSFPSNVLLLQDKSSNLRRVARLVMRGAIPIFAILKMSIAELVRPKLPSKKIVTPIHSNVELLELYNKHKPDQIILFRCGLIVDRDKFPADLDFFNVHCATIPQYGGLASLHRAIQNGDYRQNATIHRLTNKIDQGEVVKVLEYDMLPTNSYRKNEDIAYSAGFKLLRDFIAREP